MRQGRTKARGASVVPARGDKPELVEQAQVKTKTVSSPISDWICLKSVIGYNKKKWFAQVNSELKRIFGKVSRVEFIGLDQDIGAECYVFVRVVDYPSCKAELKRSKAFSSIVEDYDNPYYFPEKEVEDFKLSAENSGKLQCLYRGDVVKVKRGYLSGLFGIVDGYCGHNTYSVQFRLYIKSFKQEICLEDLSFKSSIFNHLSRFPIME